MLDVFIGVCYQLTEINFSRSFHCAVFDRMSQAYQYFLVLSHSPLLLSMPCVVQLSFCLYIALQRNKRIRCVPVLLVRPLHAMREWIINRQQLSLVGMHYHYRRITQAHQRFTSRTWQLDSIVSSQANRCIGQLSICRHRAAVFLALV